MTTKEAFHAPKTMRAAQGKDYGDIDEMISVQDGVKVPSLSDLPPKQRKHMMLVKVLSVALAPGDCRVLSGKTRELQGPPSFPYIPCGDCCGVVVELPKDDNGNDMEENESLPFQVGDRIAARFVGKPLGALGEYAIVSTLVADKVPQSLSSDGAAALASACPATIFSERIHDTDRRILVLGAGGGMGSHFCQLIANHPADRFVVGVSRSPERLLKSPLNYNKAIDYTRDDPFQLKEYQDDPFDCIVDFGSGGWLRIKDAATKGWPSIVKASSMGGRYLTTSVDTPTYECHSMWSVLKIFLFPPLWRALASRTWARGRMPKYTFGMSLPEDRAVMTNTMKYASNKSLVPVIHGDKPFTFTTTGVRDAFKALNDHHPHGKVVIHVADDDQT